MKLLTVYKTKTMIDPFEYIIKANIVFIILVVLYQLTLKNETTHYFKRFILLSIPIISLCSPFIQIRMNKEHVSTQLVELISNTQLVSQSEAISQTSNSVSQLIAKGSILGSILLSVLVLLGFARLAYIISTSRKEELNIGTLCDSNRVQSPFSFIQYIVLNKKSFSTDELHTVIAHEQSHIRGKHFVDIIISNLMILFFWWNPISWIYRVFVVENLEYIVDQKVIELGIDKKAYQFSILKFGIHETYPVFANHFAHSLIKKRISMMNKKLSKPRVMFRSIIAVPLFFACCIAFGQVTIQDNSNQVNNQSSFIDSQNKNSNEELTLIADEMTYEDVSNEKYLSVSQSKQVEKQYKTSLEVKQDTSKLELPSDEQTEYYVNGKRSNKQEVSKLNPDQIQSVDVIKEGENGKSRVEVTLNNVVQYYVDGKKMNAEYVKQIDQGEIKAVDIKKNVQNGMDEVYVTLKRPVKIFYGDEEVSDEHFRKMMNDKQVGELFVQKNPEEEFNRIIIKPNDAPVKNQYFVNDERISEKQFKATYQSFDFFKSQRIRVIHNGTVLNYHLFWTTKAKWENRKSRKYYEEKFGIKLPPPPPPPPPASARPESPPPPPPPPPTPPTPLAS